MIRSSQRRCRHKVLIGMAPGGGQDLPHAAGGSRTVCLTTAPSAQRLLRRGARLAGALDAPLLVLTVLDSHRLLSRDEGLRLEQCEQLCARSRRITQIVLGQSRATSLAGLLRRPLSEQLQRQLRGLGIDLHLIGESADEPAAEPAAELER
jgi:two-component system sensor histidine kinase KdpD